MSSERQIAANRRNARRSTGPRTISGKSRSRRNAIRHGLSAETVITSLEDVDDYRTLEASLLRDYAPVSAIEQQLVEKASITALETSAGDPYRDGSIRGSKQIRVAKKL